ncbi:malto-oligosyltrehalose trehalohydrolase [Ramlibacter sp. USB13]|uniref:Malto-oligosyltrehalose trehalohydrolase n=1 Tax=Ramlibacter cellulosilyticus TaxID=2764187 RepID=A0A923SHS3_9BURK|nr:malto-oligosyltrehalose trehalohydrolase [Ramlibacter cellulosilyticus]MBC5786192.1 malto-oligosyltrehalose trehalohydrolase [Ramlibacter cellulosilyticus]
MTTSSRRRLPIGAEYRPREGTHFRVWAPAAKRVDVVFDGVAAAVPLRHEGDGYFSGFADHAEPGARYRFRLDGGDTFPDPASRWQPEGPHGPSEVVALDAYRWTDADWRGVTARGQVLYEMHIGTFTPEGTYRAAEEHLPFLKDVGITVIELMPVNEFNGPFGWGYDGVNLFAPTRLYGTPDDLRHFIDRAHALGLGVILDVVYNHFGPSGNYVTRFSRDYVSSKYDNEWGDAINFDGENGAPVREFFACNAAYWIDEFHFDGLRLDATQCLFDASEKYIVAEIVERARAAAPGRSIYISAENEPQHAELARPPGRGGMGVDALWNDDFHHSATVAATGGCEAYFSETRGTPQELISSLKWGFLYQGQFYAWQKKRRGHPSLDLPATAFIQFLQNHDQVANSARGQRLHQLTSPGRFRALTALMLLTPCTPLLFMGQEFAASAPFLYFARHEDELNTLIRKGRHEFLTQFPNIASEDGGKLLAVPADEETFRRCKLDHGERERNAHVVALHRDLLRLRREDPVFSRCDAQRMHGAVLGPEAFLLRFLDEAGDDRLLVVNLGPTLPLYPMPEPLLAPPAGCRWQLLWNSEDPRYGGNGMIEPDGEHSWRLPAHALAVLAPRTMEDDDG